MQATTATSVPGQSRALWMSTIAFTVCFAVWTIFAIIGIQIKQQLGLNETQFGLLVGTPILTGSLVRIFLGIWTDQIGGRRIYTVVMLAAALATFLLTYAHTYPQILVAALGVGIAGGSFAVGIAYVSRWYPAEKQGTALGIFGAGNVGAAVTKFCAPFVLVAYGWQTTAQVWAAAIAIMGVVFWFITKEDPVELARRAKGERPRSTWLELEPLKNVQVWRFALYYFFTFGAFVALSLWLPRYLIGVYKLDIETAGMLGAAYSIPASLFRIYGGVLSDRYGARRIMYWMFGVSALITFILAYPPTDYVVQSINGPLHFHMATGVVTFTCLIFVLGFFMSLGKAAVYKHIPVYYPNNVGSVGGLVGMIGGLGGFVLPIAFGALNDLTGIWTSCFMLLFLIAGGSLVWMHFAIQRMERGALATGLRKLPEFPEMEPIHEEKHVGAHGPARAGGMEAGGPRVLGREGARHRPPQSVDLDSGAAARLRDLDGVVGGRRQAAGGRLQVHHRSAVLARRHARPVGRDAAHLLFVHAADLRRAAVDLDVDLVADGAGGRHRPCGAKPGHSLHLLPVAGAAVRPRRRQLRLLDGQYQLLLPEGGEGQRARAQCRARQSRRQRRAIRHSAGDHHRRVRLVRRRSAEPPRAEPPSSGCRMPASSGCRSSPSPPSRPGSACTTSRTCARRLPIRR